MLSDTILATAGRTPLVRLQRIGRELGATIALKLETTGPTQSIADRIALAVFERGEADGLLAPGGTVIEAGSGNLGTALAAAAAVLGYRLIFVTDDAQTQEKLDAIKAYGAQLIVCPGAVKPEDPRSRQSVAQRLSEETPHAFYPCTTEDDIARDVHERTTGPELWDQAGGRITHLFVGVGTGATLSGLGRALKARSPAVKIIGVEPRGSVVREWWQKGRIGAEAAPFLVEEIGADQPPVALDLDVLDDVVQVADRDAVRLARQLARMEGVLAGGAGGAVLAACLATLRATPSAAEAFAVCVIPDSGFRYLSKVFNERWLAENRLIDAPLELTAQAICERKQHDGGIPRLCAVGPCSLVIEAVELMRQYGISQIPVVDGDRVLGSVKEGRLIHLLLADQDAKSHPVKDVLDEAFPIVAPDARIDEVSQLLTSDNPAVLVRGERGLDILTKADLIRAIAR